MPTTALETNLPDHAVPVTRAGDWERIHDPDISLVLMRRDLGPRFEADLKESRWPRDFEIRRDSTEKDVWTRHVWARSLAFLRAPLREALIDDVLWLMKGFDRLGDGPFRLSLMAVASVMCPAFHADSYGFRLITTYRGPGTQWVPATNVNWAKITSRNFEERILDPEEIRSVPTGSVALMQGDSPASRVPGLVHRSPPHGADAPPRIVLRMDYR